MTTLESIPSSYILPTVPDITPTQIRELQDTLNAAAAWLAYPVKLIVLPPVPRRNGAA